MGTQHTTWDDKIEEVGKALEQMSSALEASGDEGKEIVASLKAQFSFVESEEFEAEAKKKFNEGNNGEPLNFEQFFPIIKEASKDFGEKISEEEAKEAFKDIDEDGSGTIGMEEFGKFVILVVLACACKAMGEAVEKLG